MGETLYVSMRWGMSDKSILLPEGLCLIGLNATANLILATPSKKPCKVLNPKALVQILIIILAKKYYTNNSSKVGVQKSSSDWQVICVTSFPHMRGWSSSNLKYMRFFAQNCQRFNWSAAC